MEAEIVRMVNDFQESGSEFGLVLVGDFHRVTHLLDEAVRHGVMAVVSLARAEMRFDEGKRLMIRRFDGSGGSVMRIRCLRPGWVWVSSEVDSSRVLESALMHLRASAVIRKH